MDKPKNQLSPKHLQALELIRSNTHSFREIAKIIGWSEDHLQKLIAGDTQVAGSSASLFAAEVDRIMVEKTKEIRTLTKATQKNLLSVFHEYSNSIQGRKIDKKTLSTAVSIINALGKSTPNVEIGSFQYTQGLSLEDIRNEYRRIRSILSDTGRIRPSLEGGPGQDTESGEPGDPSS